jgi:hypothetical protein
MQEKITNVTCWICGYPVPLQECKPDDRGRPVHENCYAAAIKETPPKKAATASLIRNY